jgi:hypothetical protein
LKELSEMGIKLPIFKPCFSIQVHVICPAEGNEKVSPPTEVSYGNGLIILLMIKEALNMILKGI